MTLSDLSVATDAKPKRGGHNGHEAIVGRCPACASEGRDKTGNHLLAWTDEEWLHFCRCPVGHEETEMLSALGWSQDDRRLAPRAQTISGERPPKPTHDGKTWVYTDGLGNSQLVKTKKVSWDARNSGGQGGKWRKDYPQSTPDGTRPGERGQTLLYNLVDVIAAVKDGRTIYVNEGEKACDAFIARGLVATCQPNGAAKGANLSQKWTDHHTAFLSGASEVVIVADRDLPDDEGVVVGVAYAEYVASRLRPVVGNVSVVQSATKGDRDDAWDHFTQGFGIENFVPLPAETVGELTAVSAPPAGPWRIMTPDDLLALPDKRMLVEGLIGEQDRWMIFGSPGCAKTFTVLNLLVTCAVGGTFAHTFDVPEPLKVAYCSSEGQFAFKRRFAACLAQHGLEVADVRGNMRFVSDVPQFFDQDGDRGVWGFVEQLEAENFRPDLLVIDTLSTASLGSKEVDNSEAALVCDVAGRVCKRLDCSVGFVHHTGWSTKKPKPGEEPEEERPRGASAFHGAMDVMISQRLDQETRAGVVRYFKGKDIEPFAPLPFDLQGVAEFKTAVVDFTRANPAMAEATTLGAILLAMSEDRKKEWWSAAEIHAKSKGATIKAIHTTLHRKSFHGPGYAFEWDGRDKPKRYRLAKRIESQAGVTAGNSRDEAASQSNSEEKQEETGR